MRFRLAAVRGSDDRPSAFRIRHSPFAIRQFPPMAEAIRLRIEGMTCGGCVARVERALQSVDGVAHARVNLTTQVATIDPGGQMPDRQALIEAVRAAGYDA